MQKQDVYDAERFAFEGTPLADLQREENLIADYRRVLDSDWWSFGEVDIRRARADMVTAGGRASYRWVQTSAGRTHRYTVSHELAHVLHRRTFRTAGDAGHGERFRRAHVITAASIFGHHYGWMLEDTYNRCGLAVAVHPGRIAVAHNPIIDIDALSVASAPTGGWNRRGS